MHALDEAKLLEHLGTLVKGELTGTYRPRKKNPGKDLVALPQGSTVELLEKAHLGYHDGPGLQFLPGYILVQRGALPDGREYEFLQLELKALLPLGLGRLVEGAPRPLNHPLLSGYQLRMLAYENGGDVIPVNRKDIAKFQPWRIGRSIRPRADIPTGAAIAEGANVRVRYLGHGMPIEDRLYARTPAPSHPDGRASGP